MFSESLAFSARDRLCSQNVNEDRRCFWRGISLLFLYDFLMNHLLRGTKEPETQPDLCRSDSWSTGLLGCFVKTLGGRRAFQPGLAKAEPKEGVNVPRKFRGHFLRLSLRLEKTDLQSCLHEFTQLGLHSATLICLPETWRFLAGSPEACSPGTMRSRTLAHRITLGTSPQRLHGSTCRELLSFQ